MNIGIIGGGSTGLLLSFYLSRKHAVTIYVRREDQKRKLDNEGLILQNISAPIKIRALLSSDLQEEDCFIICVKQLAVPAVIPLLQKMSEQIPLIFLQNGMGHLDEIKKLNNPILLGVIEHGALRHRDNLVQHTGKGIIKLAAFQGDGKLLYALSVKLNQHDFPFGFEDDYMALLKEKLVINAVINPLTALFQVCNGEVTRNPYLYRMARIICRETCSVLDMDFSIEWAKVENICNNTEQNRSSMLKDMADHRKTEIDAISGYILKKGKDLPIPYTAFLYDSIKALETRREL